MTNTAPFALNFSGPQVFEQEERAQRLLAETPIHEHAARARLHATLAAARVVTEPDLASAAAKASALEAEKSADDAARAWALTAASLADLSCETTSRRREMAEEALSIAQATGEGDIVETAYFIHLAALAELGEISRLDQALAATNRLFSSFPWLEQGRHSARFRCLRATIDGHVELAEQLAHHAYALAQANDDPDARAAWVAQVAIVRWMQGRVVELEPAFLLARQTAPHEPVWAVSLAWMWMRQGRRSAARALITSLPAVDGLPVDRNWLATLCILADVAAELGERETVAQLRPVLQRFEGRLVTIGLGITCWGTVSRPLARIALALGDPETAITHYRRAIEMTARIGAHPWLAEAQAELAAVLMNRADGDRQEADALAAEAAATARALRLHGIEGAAEAVLAASRPGATSSSGLAAALEKARPRIVVLGDFEVRSGDGTVARWQSRKARQLLKILVARRGVAVDRQTLMHILWPNESPPRVANRFSVAATAVRRALDPSGALPRDSYLETQNGLVRLCVERLDIDVERFLAAAESALSSTGSPDTTAAQLREALALYTGEPFTDEPEELWAEELRREAHVSFFTAAHTLAELSATLRDHLTRVEAYRRVLTIDDYDQRAHEGLIDALTRLRSHGQAALARSSYMQRMAELGLSASPGAEVS